jgi:hypothetical protein
MVSGEGPASDRALRVLAGRRVDGTKLLRRSSVFGVLSQDTRATVTAAPIAFVESAAPLLSAWILQGQ